MDILERSNDTFDFFETEYDLKVLHLQIGKSTIFQKTQC